jgi:putative redox protein
MGQWVEGQVTLMGDAGRVAFRGTNARGHSIVLESGHGVSPMEVVLLGLGGCTGIDVISTLGKMRQDVTGYEVHVRGERRDEHPRVYTQIVVEHVIRGHNLKPDAVRRAVELSSMKYCSVSAMLEQSAKLTVTYRLIDHATGEEQTGSL